MIRRHWWVVMLAILIGIGAAAGDARNQSKVYRSVTSVLVLPTSGTLNLDTEAQLVVSTDIASAAGKLLKVGTPPAVLVSHLRVAVPANTTVLSIWYEAATPRAAQAGSHAFAAAYLASRQGAAQASVAAQVNALNTKIKQYGTTLNALSGRLAHLRTSDPNRAALGSQITTLTNQITALTSQANQLSGTPVTSGRIISDATLPTAPVRPRVPLYLIGGGVAGLLLGLALAGARERIGRRLRPADLPRHAEVPPLLAQLPKRPKPRFDEVFPAHGSTGRIFNRLRNELLASLDSDDRVIVVTGASRGNAASVVAANLASALARTGSEVILVCAQLPDSLALATPTSRLLGVAPVPGLAEILAGKVSPDEGIQQAPRNPWLRVVTPGGTASAAGLLQSQQVRETLDGLRGEAEYLVIEAPATSVSADAQSLASLADAAILAVELRRTTRTELADAAAQLRRVGTPLLGVVLLPRLRRFKDRRQRLAADPVLSTEDSAVDLESADLEPADLVSAEMNQGGGEHLPVAPPRVGEPRQSAETQQSTETQQSGARPARRTRTRSDDTVVMARLDYHTLTEDEESAP